MSDSPVDADLISEIRAEIDAMQQELSGAVAEAGLIPLELKCTMASCRHGKHCLDHLRRPRRGETGPEPGCCRDCGENVAELPEPGGRQYGDDAAILETCQAQQAELIRAHYWQVPIDQWAINQALRLGRRQLLQKVAQAIPAAMDPTNRFAGRGASYSGQIVAYAQHATATCCRRCAGYWHGTPADDTSELSRRQLEHLIKIASAYLQVRLPDLPDEPTADVGVIHRARLFAAGESSELDDAVFHALSEGQDPTGVVVPFESALTVQAARRGLIVSRRIEGSSGA